MNEENTRIIQDCRDDIIKIQDWIRNNPFDSNVKFLVSYAVVKSSGTIEIVFKRIIHSFLSDGCKDETQKYLERIIVDSSANPSTGKIEGFIERFDSTRKNSFSTMLKGTKEKSDLNSLVQLRNDIAHGRAISVSIGTVKDYFESGVHILNVLDSLL